MTIATLFFALLTTLPTASEVGGTAGSSRPIILDFTASWCGPCRQMKPAVEQLVRQGYPVKPVDLDENRDLAEKYEVEAVPTFVIIDPSSGRELGRSSGLQPVQDLASLYNKSAAKVARRPRAEPADDDAREARDGDNEADRAEPPAKPARRVNPNPWETVVRIKVHGHGLIGYGSGTIIHSSPTEAIILTCAHIFKLENGPQAPPSRFPSKITIDLFDGVLGGPKNNQVHYSNETLAGEAIDYDFNRDVGLIRIRPGRRLPYARVVPPHWTPKAGMVGLFTVGCSEGSDATTWKTRIVNPSFRGLAGKKTYEAIECVTAPKQGRSGGGLFTSDGYVAGVCDFAEPTGNHGLYASPRSIYSILDRNDLVALYDPAAGRGNSQLADNGGRRGPAPSRDDGGRMVARGQSPGRDDPGGVTLPPPAMLGIKPPVLVSAEGRTDSARRSGWIARPVSQGEVAAELKMDPSTDPDRFNTIEPSGAPEPREEAAEAPSSGTDIPVRRSVRGKWRPVREATTPEPAGLPVN